MHRKSLVVRAVVLVSSVFAFACSADSGGAPIETNDGTTTASEQDVRGLKHCAGLTGAACSSGLTCVDDPIDACDPTAGGRDCQGICVDVKTAPKCGGVAGLDCEAGLACVDDPTTGCNPAKGDRDCGGVCVKSACDPHLAITATCAKGTSFDLAKCACVASTPTCDPHIAVTATCAQGKHFDAQKCACVDTGPTDCRTLTCASGMHCAMKGINGASIAVCVN